MKYYAITEGELKTLFGCAILANCREAAKDVVDNIKRRNIKYVPEKTPSKIGLGEKACKAIPGRLINRR